MQLSVAQTGRITMNLMIRPNWQSLWRQKEKSSNVIVMSEMKYVTILRGYLKHTKGMNQDQSSKRNETETRTR